MSENDLRTPTLLTAWGADLELAACERCHATFLIPCNGPTPRCPLCSQAGLQTQPMIYDGIHSRPAEAAYPYLAELVLPFDLADQKLEESIHDFAASIPFAPPELNSAALRSRLKTMYLPMWLVDSDVYAHWQAEAGFDYQVISHQEFYELNHWSSREVKEPRVRWENRVGRLNRTYQNVATPALDEAARLEKRLGRFAIDRALSYTPDRIHHALVRMPDHPPKAAWSETVAAFQKTAADECLRACAANHLRQFRWKVRFNRLNWTLMLLPVYATSYTDEEGKPQPILIHGQTGAVSGPRRASLRRAGRMGALVLILGLLLFLAGMLAEAASAGTGANPAGAALSTYLIVLGLAGILASCLPLVVAWDFNRQQRLEENAGF